MDRLRLRMGVSIPVSAFVITAITVSATIMAGSILMSRAAPHASSASAIMRASIEPWANGGILSVSVVNTGNVELTIRQVWLEGPSAAGCPRPRPGLTLKPGFKWSDDVFMPCVRSLEDYVVLAELQTPSGSSIIVSTKVVWKAWEGGR